MQVESFLDISNYTYMFWTFERSKWCEDTERNDRTKTIVNSINDKARGEKGGD